MSEAELREWMAFYALEPWGALIEDHRIGTVAALLANIHRDRKRRLQPYSWQDFFPQPETKTTKRAEASLKAAFSERTKPKPKQDDGRKDRVQNSRRGRG